MMSPTWQRTLLHGGAIRHPPSSESCTLPGSVPVAGRSGSAWSLLGEFSSASSADRPVEQVVDALAGDRRWFQALECRRPSSSGNNSLLIKLAAGDVRCWRSAGRTLLMATMMRTPAARACAMASSVCGMTPSVAGDHDHRDVGDVRAPRHASW